MSVITDCLETTTPQINRGITGNEESQYFSYRAYGLGIRSVIPIPNFIPSKGTGDVTITIDEHHSPDDYVPQEVIEQPLALQLEPEKAIVYIKDVGVFLIHRGCEVIMILAPEVDQAKLQLALVGTVMAIILQQRGALVLHGSAVEIDGQAVLFLGNSGEGKSSMAAAFQAQGYPIITDDIAAVSWEEGKPVLAPGFPQVKLSREVVESLSYNWNALGTLHPSIDKRGLRLGQNFPQKLLPIHRIYLLSSGAEIRCEPMTLQGGLMALIQHSELMKLVDSEEVTNFQQCARLAQSCEVVGLQRPRDLGLLPELVKIVAEDVGAS